MKPRRRRLGTDGSFLDMSDGEAPTPRRPADAPLSPKFELITHETKSIAKRRGNESKYTALVATDRIPHALLDEM